MKNLVLLITLLASFSSSIFGMEVSPFVFKQATEADAPGILELINAQATGDNDKIVILPKRFREPAIQSAIKNGKFFIAIDTKTQKPVGFKKLFHIDEKELHEIVSDELHCKDKPAECGRVALAKDEYQEQADAIAPVFASSAVYIYNGNDFSHPAYRGKGINTALTNFALATVAPKVADAITSQKCTHLALVYGLASANTGSGILQGRTPGILHQSFVPFAKKIAVQTGHQEPEQILMSRHRAFMPTFDPEATECKPLSQDKAVPGFGCVLACRLEKLKKDA